jgi:integrase
LEQKDDLLAGRVPRKQSDPDGLTLGGLVNQFLARKKELVDAGELSPRTWSDYHNVGRRMLQLWSKTRLVNDLRIDDFAKFRAELVKSLGPVALGNEIQRARVVFNFAYQEGLIDKPVRYGSNFRRPSKKALREERNKKGERMLEPADLRRLIDKASQPMKAMVLLAVNAGFGNNDVGLLPLSAIDLDGGWVKFPRPKTAIKRRCALWPETAAALREWLDMRPAPKDEADAELVFVTKYGQCWSKGRDLRIDDGDGQLSVKGDRSNPISAEFRKLLNKEKLHRPGISFYSLRHVTETIGGESCDQVAVNAIMGHVDESMAAAYRERVSDERLQQVTDCIRRWLYADVDDQSEGPVTLRIHAPQGDEPPARKAK